VVLADISVLILQRKNLRDNAKEELQTEVILLGELATNALLSSRYDEIDALIHRWVERKAYIVQVIATMPNGFALSNVSKSQTSGDVLRVKHEVYYANQHLITLEAIADYSVAELRFTHIVITVTLATVGIVLLLGWLLWITLQHTAIKPLEKQIHAREQKERELLERTTALEFSINELESFSYSVSHDLRGPLRAIDGYSRILMEDYAASLSADAQHKLNRIRDGVQRMGLLIDDLLELSRVGRSEIQFTDIDMSELVLSLIEVCRKINPDRIVDVVVQPDIHCRADARLIKLVLQNLLENAWKYSRKNLEAKIEFGSDKHDAGLSYFVRDNGVGFDMAYAKKLFQPFQRLHGQNEYEGTGVGLAIVHRIIARHGGRVWAEAEVGKGATFHFTLAAC
jgi:signal transduction histidine kinase